MTLRTLLSLLPMVGALLLTACPQMTTSPIGAPGSPLSAVGEEKTASEKAPDSEEAIAPPSAAAPIPPPAVSGGGDPAGTTPPPMEPAFRHIEGSGVGGETPITISGPVAAGDRGLISAPSSREPVDTHADNLRVVCWPSNERRTWSNAEDFFAKLAAGQITDDVADGAKATHWPIMVFPPLEGDPPMIVAREEDVMDNGLIQEPGDCLFFFTADGLLWDLGPETVPVTSAAHLKGLVRLDQTDREGHPFRIRFMGERVYIPHIDLDPRLLMERPSYLPGTFKPILRDIIIPAPPR